MRTGRTNTRGGNSGIGFPSGVGALQAQINPHFLFNALNTLYGVIGRENATARKLAILLLKWMHHLSKAKWSLSNLTSMLRMILFTYRDLTAWLDNPFGTPPLSPDPLQPNLGLV